MLSNEQKKLLKKEASKLSATIIIGKDGLTDNILDNVFNDLTAHELVKINVLKTCDQDINSLALDIAGECNANIVQIIGRVIILYKESKKHLYL